MGIQAMVTSYNANSRRVKKPTYFESADLSKTTFRKIQKKKPSAEELDAVKQKIKRQNRVENIIYGVVALGAILLTITIY